MKILLKNIHLINPVKNIDEKNSSLLIIDGKIASVGGTEANEKNDIKIFDLKGKIVAPGFFDLHVHLREPGREDEETVVSGCNAAANGGFTGIACMPNTDPAIDSAEIVNFSRRQARNHLVDVFPVGAATICRKGEVISPMAELSEAGAVAFSDDGIAIKTASILRRAY